MKIRHILIILTGLIMSSMTAIYTPAQQTLMQEVRSISGSIREENGRFRNKIELVDPTFREYMKMTRDFFFDRTERKPKHDLPTQNVDLNYFNNRTPNRLNATWLGHSSLMININGYRVLTDPVFENKTTILGPGRFNGDVPLNPNKLDTVDAVVISHDHYDHLNKKSMQLLSAKTSCFLVPLKVGDLLVKWGVDVEKIVELDWWDEHKFNNDLKFVCTPAQHFSGRGLGDRNKTLWASWVVESSDHKIYYSGDSGYFDGFKQIGEKFGPFDMTFLECGAYDMQWHQLHMLPEETVQAHLDLRGNILHPVHWGTFNLAMHPWYEPMQRLTRAAEAEGIQVATPICGGTTIYPDQIPNRKWWEEREEITDNQKQLSKINQ